MSSINNISHGAGKITQLFLITCFLSTKLIASPDNTDYHAENYQPFETRDQNILNLIHGQALPTNAHLNGKAQKQWSTGLIITNALNIESNSNESIYLDYEAYRFNFSYQYGLNDNWSLKLDIPLIYQTGGFLDSAIDDWHNFFGLPRANRPLIEDNQYSVNYQNKNSPLFDLNKSSATLGDIQIAIARSLIKRRQTTLSLWGSLKLPTGDENKLSSNGATDFSVWLALNQQLQQNWLINMNTGIVILGKDEFQHIPLADHVLYGHIMLAWIATDDVHLKVQLQGHTSYYDDSQLKILGNSYFLTFGSSIKINQCNQLDLAVSEDIKVNASPDASFLINWRHFSSRCKN